MERRTSFQEFQDRVKSYLIWLYGLSFPRFSELPQEIRTELIKKSITTLIQVVMMLLVLLGSILLRAALTVLGFQKYIHKSEHYKEPGAITTMLVFCWLTFTYCSILGKLIWTQESLRHCPCRHYPICLLAYKCIMYGLHIFAIFVFDKTFSLSSTAYLRSLSKSNVFPKAERVELLLIFRMLSFCLYVLCQVAFMNFDFIHFTKQHFETTPPLAFYLLLFNCTSQCVALMLALPQNLFYPTTWFHCMHYLEGLV